VPERFFRLVKERTMMIWQFSREQAYGIMRETIGLLAASRRAGGIKGECESLLACFDSYDHRKAWAALGLPAANEYFRYFADIAEWAGLETLTKTRIGEVNELGKTGDSRYLRAADSPKKYTDTLSFYKNLAESTAGYKAKGSETYCNVFVRAMLREQFGEDTQTKIFPGGLERSNIMFEKFKVNGYLEKINTTSMEEIQDMADRGIVIIFASKNDNGPGHMAFVGHSSQVINTDVVPAIEGYLQQGKKITQLDKAWLPVLVQAGENTGVTSARYATTGWLENKVEQLNNSIHFYAIRAEAL